MWWHHVTSYYVALLSLSFATSHRTELHLTFKCARQLEQLERLEQLVQLDQLDQLDQLEQLQRLEQLQQLEQLELLEQLQRFEQLDGGDSVASTRVCCRWRDQAGKGPRLMVTYVRPTYTYMYTYTYTYTYVRPTYTYVRPTYTYTYTYTYVRPVTDKQKRKYREAEAGFLI